MTVENFFFLFRQNTQIEKDSIAKVRGCVGVDVRSCLSVCGAGGGGCRVLGV